VSQNRAIEVSGFEVVRSISYPGLGWIGTAADSLVAEVGADSGTVVLKHEGESVLTLEVGAALRAALAPDSLTQIGHTQLDRPVVVDGQGGGYRARLVLEFLSGHHRVGGPVLISGSGYLLLGGLQPERR
jgi:hypothetical protein